MKSILERALVHLLNEENEKAEELLHQFVIEQARSIHESLREEDDSDLDEVNEGDEFFTEADLADAESDEAVADLGDDLGEVPQDAAADDLGDDTLDDEAMGGDDMGDMDGEVDETGEDDLSVEMDEFEKELADLQAKFDEMVASAGDGEDMPDEDDMGASDEMSDDMGSEGSEFASDDSAPVEGEGEEEFDDITESIVDELQKVTVPNTEGKGANGEQLQTNKQSTVTKSVGTASPNMSKQAQHKGFARETSPGTDTLKGGKTVADTSVRNVQGSRAKVQAKVSKEGDKGAILNKAPATQDKSTITGGKNRPVNGKK